MSVAATMERKLRDALSPQHLELIDDSARHASHKGAHPDGETHFKLHIVSPIFSGLSRLDRQRRVHAVLAEELASRVHALSIKAQSPEEAE